MNVCSRHNADHPLCACSVHVYHVMLNIAARCSELWVAYAVSESKPKRPEYKFQKKPARTKGNRGKADDGNTAYDGQAFTTGRRGGLVRVPVTKA